MNTTQPSKFTLKKVLAASIIAISLPLTSLALAEDAGPNAGNPHHKMDRGSHCEKGGKMHHGMGKPGVPAYLRDVNLTSAQEDQLFSLMYAQMPIARDQAKQSMQLRVALRTATQADKFDEAKVQQLADKMATLEKEKTMMRARNEAKIFALLTPEQRVKAREAKIAMHDFGRERNYRGEHTKFKGVNQPSNATKS